MPARNRQIPLRENLDEMKTPIRSAVLGSIFSLAVSAVLFPQDPKPSNTFLIPGDTLCATAEKVVYKKTPQGELLLYILRPEINRTAPLPAIVYFTGGGWVGGEPRDQIANAAWFRDRGMIGITADYRVRSRHGTTPLECVKDAKSAIRYVRGHAKELGVDPSRIIAAGGSAGGHIAACTVLTEGRDEPGEDASVSSRADALVLHNPVLGGKGFGAEFFKEHPECAPILCVRPGLPPAILSCGTEDEVTPYEEARRFVRLMNEDGNACELITIPGAGHSCDWPAANPHFQPTLKRMAEFLKKKGFMPDSSDCGTLPQSH
jgi:acetyl esterase